MATKAIQVELLLGGVMDDGDVALAGGKVFTYAAGTLTNKTTWTDRDKASPATNPIILDASGKATIFADGVYKFVIKDADDVTIRTIDNLEFGQTFTGIFNLSKGIDIASSSALTLGDDGNYFDVTGTTSINSIGAVGIGTVIKLHFDAALTLTHHATNLILPGGANITTAAGDEAEFIEYTAGGWICTNYNKTRGSFSVTKGSDVASATTLSLGAYGNYFDITGTAAITSIATIGIGTVVNLHFDAALTFTFHSTNLVLPGGADIVTAAGDEAEMFEYDTGKWVCTNYSRARGAPNITKGADVASASALALGVYGNYFDITGTAAITSINTVGIGTVIKLHFDAALTLTHHATDLILPGAANITTVAGDEAEFVEYATGDWRLTSYSKPVSFFSASVDQDAVGPAAIGQGELKTAMGAVSTSSSSSVNLTLPGATYGLYPQTKESGDGISATIAALTVEIGNTYITNISLRVVSSGTAFAQQRYVQASPPYNLGNGDISLFMFAVIDNTTREIESMYVAPDPCWAYNGPNAIDPKKRYNKKGKANQFYKKKFPLPDPETNFASFKAAINGPREEVEIEITQEVKNQDMIHVPHPFMRNDLTGKSIVLIDPIGQMTDKLALLHEEGESISDLFHKKYLLVGNTPLNANTPQGVGAYKAKWKN